MIVWSTAEPMYHSCGSGCADTTGRIDAIEISGRNIASSKNTGDPEKPRPPPRVLVLNRILRPLLNSMRLMAVRPPNMAHLRRQPLVRINQIVQAG